MSCFSFRSWRLRRRLGAFSRRYSFRISNHMSRKRTFENPAYCGGAESKLVFPSYEVTLKRNDPQNAAEGDAKEKENEAEKKVTSARFRPGNKTPGGRPVDATSKEL